MDFFDVNGDGKKDLIDDMLEFKIVEECFGDDRKPKRKKNDIGLFAKIIIVIEMIVLVGGCILLPVKLLVLLFQSSMYLVVAFFVWMAASIGYICIWEKIDAEHYLPMEITMAVIFF